MIRCFGYKAYIGIGCVGGLIQDLYKCIILLVLKTSSLFNLKSLMLI